MVLTTPSALSVVHERVKRSAQCVAEAGLCKLAFQAMSTTCRVHFRSPNPAAARDFPAEVLRWVAGFEACYSRFIPESLIGRINAAAGEHWVDIDPETEALLKLCGDMVFFTRGVFDPTALPLIRLWNWKASPPVVPGEADILAAQERVGWRKVQCRPGAVFLPQTGMCLDLGGIGKEYAVDRVVMLAGQFGIQHVLVDFGQDVRVQGEPPEKAAWHIGLEDPRHPGRCWTGVAVTRQAVATSGDYLRHFFHGGRRYGHIIDPRTGYPVNNGTLSVTVIAPHCTLAGILSTTAFVLGADDGRRLLESCPGVEGCITTETNQQETKGFYAYRTS